MSRPLRAPALDLDCDAGHRGLPRDGGRPTFYAGGVSTGTCRRWDGHLVEYPATCVASKRLVDEVTRRNAAEVAGHQTFSVGRVSPDESTHAFDRNAADVDTRPSIENFRAGAVPTASVVHYPDDMAPDSRPSCPPLDDCAS